MRYTNASHTTLVTSLALLAATAVLYIMGSAAIASPPASAAKNTTNTGTVTMATPCGAEDAGSWVWSKCGNLERGIWVRKHSPRIGIIHPDGRKLHRVVTPCEFAFASHEGWLDKRTKRLRGDLFAERHGCDYRYYG